ncbi:MAG TPA: alanine racemase [Candidatus Salinicoccus stercoripullorum]|uniref:Alanine racemase n=1 Tax=Candidatus Salinicoccus stercoripullorum TaxID=2838756 RepID=A0A9D1QIZ4_9STAP|nr:alanine racemase [Candidatus Salinicoccus stercoripullorum]
MSEKYYRHTVIDVDLEAVDENYRMIQNLHPDKTFIAVVKANAYGLGSVTVADYLAARGVGFFAVATLDEAIELRMHGIREKVLVLGAVPPEDINKAIQHRIAVTAPNLEWLYEACSSMDGRYDKEVWIHIKVNSGMNRLGTSDIGEISRMIEEIDNNEHFIYEGIYSHFSSADIDSDVNAREYDEFKRITGAVKRPRYVHIQNSAGALRVKDDYCNAIRVGISLYGYYTSGYIESISEVKLKPSVMLSTKVTDMHTLSEGEGVSYGLTHRAQGREKIATLPIGYADGLLRRQTGYEVRLEDGTNCPITGRVCMDSAMISVPESAEIGDRVIIIDPERESEQSMENYSVYSETISYESLTILSRRIPRIYRGEKAGFVHNEVLK